MLRFIVHDEMTVGTSGDARQHLSSQNHTGAFYTADRKQMAQPLWETVWQSFMELSIYSVYILAILSLGIDPPPNGNIWPQDLN